MDRNGELLDYAAIEQIDVPRKGNVDRNVWDCIETAGKQRDVPRKGNVDRNVDEPLE